MFTGITLTAGQEISLEESSASSEALELSEEEANDASEGREILPNHQSVSCGSLYVQDYEYQICEAQYQRKQEKNHHKIHMQ